MLPYASTAKSNGRRDPLSTTQWSVVLAAGDSRAPGAREALAALCERYWGPLYGYIRRRGYLLEEAQDLTQEFFARFLEKNYLKTVDREKGRFRSFLLASLKHFLANEYDREKAQKRGGDVMVFSLDLVAGEERYARTPGRDETPEDAYAHQWALTLLDNVLSHVRDEYLQAGKGQLFDALKGCLTTDGTDAGYRAVAEMLGSTEGAVKVAVHRLRKRYRESLRAELQLLVAEPGDVDEEIKFLFAALSA